MKRMVCSLVLAGLLQLPLHADDYNYAAASPIEKLDLPYITTSTERIRQTFTINTQNASTDDYLLEMAHTGDINVLADVTDVGTEARPLPLSGSFPLADFNFRNLIQDRKLTSARIDDNSFLYWPSPDMKQLAQDILARKAAVPRQPLPPLDEEQTVDLLSDYFKRVHGWDGRWAKVDIQVPVADLPPELRARVEAEIHRVAISETPSGESGALLDAQSKFWKTAHLSLAPGSRVARGKPVPFLYMNRFTLKGALHSGFKIGYLEALEKK